MLFAVRSNSPNVIFPLVRFRLVKPRSFCSVIPFELSNVRLFNAAICEGIITFPIPAMVMEDVAPAIRFAGVPIIGFLRVIRLLARSKLPVVSVNA